MGKQTENKHRRRLMGGAWIRHVGGFLSILLLVGFLTAAGGMEEVRVYATGTPEKEEETAVPPAPTLLSRTDTTLRVRVESGQEVRLEEGSWQTQDTFTGLTPGTRYRITARYRETDTKYASSSSTALVATTKSAGPEAPSAPVLARRWDTMIAIEAVDGQEYSMDNGATWQTSRWFRELRPATAYSIVARIRETESRMPGKTSAPLRVSTKNPAPAAPNPPELLRVTETVIEVKTRTNTEFSVNGGETWRRDGVFSGLTGNRYYDVIARLVETDDTMASNPSRPLSVLTKALTPVAPPAPRVLTVTTTSILVGTVSDMEYSINGGRTWQVEGLFDELEEEREYTIVARYAETATRAASKPGPGAVVKTLAEVETETPGGEPGETPPDTAHPDAGAFTYALEVLGGTTVFRDPQESAVRRLLLTLEDRLRLRRGENIHVRFQVQILQPDFPGILPEGVQAPDSFRLIEAYRFQAFKTLEGEEEMPLVLEEGVPMTLLVPEAQGGHGRYLLLRLTEEDLQVLEDGDRVQASFTGDMNTESLYLFGYDIRSVREEVEVETPEPETPVEGVEGIGAVDWFSPDWWRTVFIFIGAGVMVAGLIFYKIRP